MSAVNIAVLASGTGSNFRRLVEAERQGQLGDGKVRLLVSDRPDAPVIKLATSMGISVFAKNPKMLGGKEAWEQQVREELTTASIDLVVLAGFMRLIGPVLLNAYRGKMINLHPSFLPEFKGKDAIGQALLAGVPETGVSVHYVSEALDGGEVIDQVRVRMIPGEARETLEARIHAVEHELLPKVVKNLCDMLIKEK